MRTWLIVLLFFAFMGALIGGYVLLMRRNTKASIEAIRQAAVPMACGYPEGLIPGSGRQGAAKALASSLARAGTFSCPHISIGTVVSAACGTCGPLSPAA